MEQPDADHENNRADNPPDPQDRPQEGVSYEDLPNLLSWVLGSSNEPDEFDKIVEASYGLRTWR